MFHQKVSLECKLEDKRKPEKHNVNKSTAMITLQVTPENILTDITLVREVMTCKTDRCICVHLYLNYA